MDVKQMFGKHYRRLVTERIWRSVVAGTMVCFGVDTVFLALYWLFNLGAVWLGVAIGVPSGTVVGVLLYFFKYRLTEKSLARRVDRYGLEERMITMVELSNDDSYIAELQRKDAVESLAGFSQKSIKFNISTAFTVLAAVFLTLSICLSALSVLASLGKIPYGSELFGASVSGNVNVSYIADQGGRIIGEQSQSVKIGDGTTSVRAVADNGWIFICWSDGNTYPERSESNVLSDMTFKAVFRKIDDSDPDDDDSDAADDLPYGEVIEESGGGDSNDPNGETPKDDGQGNGSGKWQDRNQFIDGATYYRDYLEFYYQYAMGIFESDTEIPQEIIDFFETYFSGI